MINILLILGLISMAALIAIGIFFIAKIYIKKNKEANSLIVYADAVTSMQENVLIYIVDNVKKKKEYWNADLTQVIIYASGKEISSKAFKSATSPNGIKLMMAGAMNSVVDTLHVIGAVKFSLWEISFDGGSTRIPLTQTINPIQKAEAERIAKKYGWTPQHDDEEKLRKLIEKEIKKSGKNKILTKGALPTHGLVAHINEGKSTGSSLRYQILVPKESTAILEMIGSDYDKVTFYHVYEGHAYKIESKFVDRIGSLWEYDLLNLEAGKIYTGLSTSLNGGKTMLPSSALYGITKNHKGEVPTIDEAELGKPLPGAEKFDMWNEEVALSYLGESYTEKMYAILVKKHYEDEYADEYLSMSRAKDFYADYAWLKGKAETADEDIHVVRQIVRLKKTDDEKTDEDKFEIEK